MGGFSSKAWKLAGAAALVAGAVAGGAGTASAGQAVALTGVAVCDTETGDQVITWTLTNNTNNTIDITASGSQDGSALTAGSASAAKVIFNPATVASLGTASGVGTATGDAVGVVAITLDAFQTSIDTSVTYNGSVTLVGGCGAAPTTTVAPTTTAPATTAPATTAPVTTIAPTTTADLGSGSGNLPGTGYHGGTLALAFVLLGAGGVLLLVRRRRVAS